MRTVVYSMNPSVDGYVADPEGSLDWGVPDDEVFAFHLAQIREVGVHLLGRRLYEAMLYWETAEQDPELDAANREWARLWKALPKVVFSRTLTRVEGSNTRLATASPAEEIERLRAEPEDGHIAIGGPDLAAHAEDLIDEYRAVVQPVLLGGGLPYFPQHGRRVRLELLETRTIRSQSVYYRYGVVR